MKAQRFIILFSILVCIALVRCGQKEGGVVSPLGEMKNPINSPHLSAEIALGKKLFFDKKLSLNNEISCATCHVADKALTDNRTLGKGVEGRMAFRNTPSLFNVGYATSFMFDAELKTLEEQILVPILDHNEMGASMPEVIAKLQSNAAYQAAAKKIYNRPFDIWVLTRSIAAYERTLISDHSDFDRFYYHNNSKAISESAQRGWKLFSGKLNCVHCHPAPFFTDFKPHNNGRTQLTDIDLGRFRVTRDSMDIGFFKTPSLRNISITAPYMHNGEVQTLDELIEYYEKGGGNGFNQEGEIKPFQINSEQKKDLINFLFSLEDF